jgi:PAS domain S-box-containing protein
VAAVDHSPGTTGHDPDGGQGHVHELLTAAVDEAARLLDADGAMVYLVDPLTGHLRFAHDAGIRSEIGRRRIREIDLPIGVGMFGRAVGERAVVITGNYLDDPAFPHAPEPDQVVRDIGIRSMVVAPLDADGDVYGALGTFSSRPDAFEPAQVGLVRALANHAAAAMRNARLIEELDRSRDALRRRAEAEQALRELAARITAQRQSSAILGDVVALAGRLVGADGVILDLLDATTGHLHWALDDGLSDQFSAEERAQLWIDVGVGATGVAVAEDRVVVADDDLAALFPPSPESTEFYERTGFHSMIAAPVTGDAGALGVIEVYSRRRAAFTAEDAGLIQALASQAAIAITNARLIEELDRSRDELARTADAERTLREIAARVSAMRDGNEILQSVIDAGVRLLDATGAMIDLLDDAGMAEAWTSKEAGVRAVSNIGLLASVELEPEVGLSGLAIRHRRVEWTGDYLADERFGHSPERDEFVRTSGIRSVIAAPLIHREVALGAITVYGDRVDAFDQADADLLAALANQAAVTIANAHLIAELERSRADLARQADSERTLREIAARVSAILDPAEVLQRIVDETTRLLESDGARIDLYDPAIDALRWAYAAGDTMKVVPEWATSGGLKAGQAVAGTAFAQQRPVRTDDYLADDRFARDDPARAFVESTGIRSVVSVPLAGDGEPLGTLSVVSRRAQAYDDADAEVLAAFATQASIAIRNARLMAELGQSRAVIERRATAEQALREIGARITAIRQPGDLLQRIVDEAQRLLRADGAVIDEFEPVEGVLIAAYDAGLTEAQRTSARGTRLHIGEGLSGKAMAERRVIAAGDYLAGDFVHSPQADEMARTTGIGDLVVAPIIGEEGPLGAIEVYSSQRHTFDEIDEAVIGGLADQAAIAITNARLIEELERSQDALARRADTERALRDITARIAALREPDVILRRVVEEAKRLLDSDGAHLTRLSESGTFLTPVVVAGEGAATDQSWLLSMEFPLGGGINGLAAERGVPIWTSDYQHDERIPHEAEDVEVAERLGLIGMAAAPLRAPGGEVIGTLAVSSARPRTFTDDELDLLQGLADQAAIAITNSTLLTRLTESEARYRYLVERAPDLVWSIGADARLTFLSDAVVRLTGHRPEELLGQHFGALVHDSSREVAEFDWTTVMASGSQEVRGRVNLAGVDGQPVPAEFIATARLDEDGRFLGANGSVRDMREQERLERELRESERRYRILASSSPDLVFATDADGRYTFLSDRAETLFGWDRGATIGEHFMRYVAPGWEEAAAASYQELVAAPEQVHTSRIDFLRGDGVPVPLEINVVGSLDDGRLTAIHGVARDVSDRERLERELRESEARYRFLVENSPDVVFSTDAEGRFTFMSDAMEAMTGWRPAELIGEHFSKVVERVSRDEAASRWAALVNEPTLEQIAHLQLLGPDGRRVPVEVSAIGMIDEEGRFAGIHGATRDISERARLEGELRRQAGELAAGEERAHLARELHDSVTQALFSMTLVSRSVEMLLDRDVAAAREQLTHLRDLQREALAEMRALIFELRPGNLEQDGLIRALRTHTAAIQGRIGLPVVVESPLQDRLPLSIEEVLYRIAQEALHNVIKHAGARQVRVDVDRTSDGVRLRIGDDGKGFDPDRVPDGHMGLAGMRARAERIGATFSCRSLPGQGTTIEVVVPDAIIAQSGAAAPPISGAIRGD